MHVQCGRDTQLKCWGGTCPPGSYAYDIENLGRLNIFGTGSTTKAGTHAIYPAGSFLCLLAFKVVISAANLNQLVVVFFRLRVVIL